MISLRQLQHLLAVAEHRNFGRAADALHITQPALSRSIQVIEAIVGASLFDRSRAGIEPTDIGRLLIRHADLLNASARDLDREIRLAKGLDLGELRIGVGPFGGSALIGPVIGRLNRLHPRLRVRLIVAPWQELPERARAREVDVIVAELADMNRFEDFQSAPLAEHAALLVCRPDHPLSKLSAPRREDMFAYPLAGPRLPSEARQRLLAGAAAASGEAAPRDEPLGIECDSSSVLKSILMHSDAVSMMPRFMVDAEVRSGHLVVLPAIDFGIRTHFGAAWLRNRSMSGPGLKFIELLREHDAALALPSGDA